MNGAEYNPGRGEVNSSRPPRGSSGGRLNMLMVAHGLPPHSIGGTEWATLRLAEALGATHDLTVLVPQRVPGLQGPRLTPSQGDGHRKLTLELPPLAQSSFSDSFLDTQVEAAFEALLDAQRFDLVHVQHLTGLSMALPGLANQRGTPTVITLHDGWMACARGQLVDIQMNVCSGPSITGCGLCLADQRAAHLAPRWASRLASGQASANRVPRDDTPLPPARWRARAANALLSHLPMTGPQRQALKQREATARYALDRASRVTAPSADLLRRFQHMGWLEATTSAGRVQRLDNLLPDRLPAAQSPGPPAPLRLVFVAPLIPTKGPQVLLEALATMPPGQVELRLIGPAVAFHRAPAFAAALQAAAPANARFLGALPRDETLRALAGAHALVLPSIWPENASVALREALLMGLPVIASDIGGSPEVIEHGRNGLLVPPGDSAALRRAITSLLDPRVLEALRLGAQQTPPGRLGATVDDWLALYEQACT